MAETGEDAPTVCYRFHRAVELIGARWSGAIIGVLFKGLHRYADIKAAIPGINDTMLAQRLRELEAAGLVERAVQATSPVRVEYRLTAKGLDLQPVVAALVVWGHKWVPLPDEQPTDRHPELGA